MKVCAAMASPRLQLADRLSRRVDSEDLIARGILKQEIGSDTTAARHDLEKGLARRGAGVQRGVDPRMPPAKSASLRTATLEAALQRRPKISELPAQVVRQGQGGAATWLPLPASVAADKLGALPAVPVPRNCHTLNRITDRLLVCAGGYAGGCLPIAPLLMLDLDTASWQPLVLQPAPSLPPCPAANLQEAWVAMSPSSTVRCGAVVAAASAATAAGPAPLLVPAARYAHTCTAVGDTLTIFAGYAGTRWTHDMWLWQPQWEQMAATPRAKTTKLHCRAGSFAPAHITVAGRTPGLLTARGVTSHESGVTVPQARAAHTLTFVPVNAGSAMPSSLRQASFTFADTSDGSATDSTVTARELAGSMLSATGVPAWRLVLFGGNDGDSVLDDCWVCQPAEFTKGSLPGWRAHAALCSSTRRQGLNTFTPLEWERLQLTDDFPARAGHTAVLHRTDLIIFGGSKGYGTTSYNDVVVLRGLAAATRTPAVAVFQPPATGKAPAPRAGHVAVMLEDEMLVAGGSDALHTFADVHVLHTSGWAWSTPSVAGWVPRALSGSAACAIGSSIVHFGGAAHDGSLSGDVHVLDTSWTAGLKSEAADAQHSHAALVGAPGVANASALHALLASAQGSLHMPHISEETDSRGSPSPATSLPASHMPEQASATATSAAATPPLSILPVDMFPTESSAGAAAESSDAASAALHSTMARLKTLSMQLQAMQEHSANKWDALAAAISAERERESVTITMLRASVDDTLKGLRTVLAPAPLSKRRGSDP